MYEVGRHSLYEVVVYLLMNVLLMQSLNFVSLNGPSKSMIRSFIPPNIVG